MGCKGCIYAYTNGFVDDSEVVLDCILNACPEPSYINKNDGFWVTVNGRATLVPFGFGLPTDCDAKVV